MILFTQFRALSDQFYRTPEHYRFVRQQVVKQVGISKITSFSPFVKFHPFACAFHE
jgi:hypothetical protein